MNSFNKKKLFAVVDYGDGSRWDALLPSSNFTQKMSTDEFLQLRWLPDDVLQIVGGYSHLQVPRTIKSLSQPMTKTQIIAFIENCKLRNVKVYLFPDRMNITALRRLFPDATDDEIRNKKKSGENDCLAMRLWLKTRNTIPKKISANIGETEWHDEYKAFNSRTNTMLNVARRYKYPRNGVDIFHTNGCDYVADEVYNKLGYRFGESASIKLRYTVMCCFKDSVTGQWRRFNGRLISARFAYDYLCGSPYGNGSIARSNVMYNWMQHKIAIKPTGSSQKIKIGHMDDEQHKKFIELRLHHRSILRALIRECRNIRDGKFVMPLTQRETWEPSKPGEASQLSLF